MEINGLEIVIYRLGQAIFGFLIVITIFCILKILEIYTQKPSNET
jgi:hypothetical protein